LTNYPFTVRPATFADYDNNGNTLVSGARTFKYDFQNRLKSMTNSANGVAATIIYDGDGNRVAKTVNGTTTRYLVDAGEASQRRSVLRTG
jgi:YD repeat-containing protein